MVTNSAGDPLIGCPDKTGRLVYATRAGARPSITIYVLQLEDLVVEAVLQVFDKTTLPAPNTQRSTAARAEIARLDAELAELAGLRGTGEISLAEWMAARKPLQELIEAARKTAGMGGRAPRDAPLLSEPGVLQRHAWPTLDFPARRAIGVCSSSASPSPAPAPGPLDEPRRPSRYHRAEPGPFTLAAWTACSVVATLN